MRGGNLGLTFDLVTNSSPGFNESAGETLSGAALTAGDGDGAALTIGAATGAALDVANLSAIAIISGSAADILPSCVRQMPSEPFTNGPRLAYLVWLQSG